MRLKQICNCLLLLLVIYLSGCQEDSENIMPPPADKVVLPNSPLAVLISNVTLHDGSYDNILDHTSCSSLVLPVTVTINGQQLVIETKGDLITVERILDESSADDDTVVIDFPVSVMLADHTIVKVNDQQLLQRMVDECITDSDDIECLDFRYPLDISVYDSNNQVPGVLMISSDEELFELIKKISDNYLAGFNFPVTMVIADSSEVMVDDNEELEELIKNHANDCDEDDDNDYNDDDTDETALVAVLTGGVWKVSSFVHETDQTAAYQNWSFTFNQNQTTASNDGVSITNGSWESYGDNGVLELHLSFGEQYPLEELGGEWKVIDYNNTSIKLKYTEEDDGSIKTLELKKA